MDKDLVIEVTPSKVSIALLEEGRLVEYNEEQSGDNFSIGNVFLGKVKRVMPALNAAFVDIGAKKDAF
ncbi:MAG: ribonuclease E/G, partial [Bacteroidales bacterium]